MDVPIVFGDCVDAEQPVLATIPDPRSSPAPQAIAVDATVHDDMRYMDAERSVLARHALRDHAKAGLGGGKMREPGFAAETGGRAGEDDGAAPERHQPARRFAPDQEPAEAADAPEILELLRLPILAAVRPATRT